MIAPAAWLVVPGRSLGHVRLGSDLEALTALGKPQYGDAAMQKSWSTWIGKSGGRIDVFEASDDAGTNHERRRIHAVRATSARFHLANGIHPGSPARMLRTAYPGGRIAVSYATSPGRVAVWDDVRHGLAWETSPNGKVLALLIHDPGQPLTGTLAGYLSSPPQKA